MIHFTSRPIHVSRLQSPRPPIVSLGRRIRQARIPRHKAIPNADIAYYVGKDIILFTMFYCTLNWAMYAAAAKKQKEDSDEK